MSRLWLILRLVLPSVWLGVIVALAFVETPLKFMAPGITVPLALGVGRIVFLALSIGSWIFLVAITLIGIARPRESRTGWMLIAGMWVVMAVESFVIRPQLAARTDVVTAGGDPGESWLHQGYIVAMVLLLLQVLIYIVHAARSVRIEAAPVAS
jgi:hypothetical protein